ncbi:hypothetical protein AXG93_4421s1200 [Marchantia polymorpha subsp. ruderalis]|uniref:Uncharacterized protein n=1 Tax=Marchantia polymorpha subsp. ruderalis TaxID=1480154 RepID=A0A176WFW9_MARPO|nr:hypothetical protein AXG93_4421s1200 [Marchantia polymorpha subsp. ruderalis]
MIRTYTSGQRLEAATRTFRGLPGADIDPGRILLPEDMDAFCKGSRRLSDLAWQAAPPDARFRSQEGRKEGSIERTHQRKAVDAFWADVLKISSKLDGRGTSVSLPYPERRSVGQRLTEDSNVRLFARSSADSATEKAQQSKGKARVGAMKAGRKEGRGKGGKGGRHVIQPK